MVVNTLQLTNRWTTVLTRLPESGMGYQLVRIVLKNGQVLHQRTVLNASVLLLNKETISEEEIAGIELER